MNSNRISFFQCIVFIVLLMGAGMAQAATVIEQVRAVPWTQDNLDALKQVFSDKEAVKAFFLDAFPDPDQDTNIGDYQLVDLQHDGKIELVATIDTSGRARYKFLYIVRKVGDRFYADYIHAGALGIGDLKSTIVDLNGDGQKQFLIPRWLADYDGAKPTPVMIDVYTWNGHSYEPANSQFPNYYKTKVLPRLQEKLNRLKNGKDKVSDEMKPLLLDVYQKEIDAVRDVTGR